jgi:Flp pilus assembly CpaE family ATPase
VTVVDCGFCLEQDEELSFDTAAPRRNGATLATLAAADLVLAVGSADPVGMHRLLRGLTDLREVVPDTVPRVVVNRVRRSAVGADPERQLAEALERYAGVDDPAFLPEDGAALDAATLRGRLLFEVAPDSPLRLALAALAAGVAGPAGRAAPGARRRLLRR